MNNTSMEIYTVVYNRYDHIELSQKHKIAAIRKSDSCFARRKKMAKEVKPESLILFYNSANNIDGNTFNGDLKGIVSVGMALSEPDPNDRCKNSVWEKTEPYSEWSFPFKVIMLSKLDKNKVLTKKKLENMLGRKVDMRSFNTAPTCAFAKISPAKISREEMIKILDYLINK